MHRVTGPAAKNRVMRIFAVHRGAIVATGLEAGNSGSEIPAPGSLAQVPPDRAHVAERGAPDRFAGHRQRREVLPHARIFRNRGDRRCGAEPQRLVRCPGQGVVVRQRAQVDELLGPHEPLADRDEEVGATTQRVRVLARQHLDGVLSVVGALVIHGEVSARHCVGKLTSRPRHTTTVSASSSGRGRLLCS